MMGEYDETQFELEGKGVINQLLWQMLPDSTTLARAEELACEIHQIIAAEWDRLDDDNR